jgi:glutathione-independent formaldehyde dehydrogenase
VILHAQLLITKIVNVTVVSMEDVPDGYKDFDQAAAKKYVLDPNKLIGKKAACGKQSCT